MTKITTQKIKTKHEHVCTSRNWAARASEWAVGWGFSNAIGGSALNELEPLHSKTIKRWLKKIKQTETVCWLTVRDTFDQAEGWIDQIVTKHSKTRMSHRFKEHGKASIANGHFIDFLGFDSARNCPHAKGHFLMDLLGFHSTHGISPP